MVFDPPRGYPRGYPRGGFMPLKLQYIALLYFSNMHAKFQLPISISVDFMIEGYLGTILDPFGSCILPALWVSVRSFLAKNPSGILSSVTGQLNTLYQITTIP